MAALVPFATQADTTVITNSVHSSASTGGNSAQNGEVVEGGAQNVVHVETVVNGEVVESYEETSSDPIEYESRYESEDGTTDIHNSVNTSQETGAEVKPSQQKVIVASAAHEAEATASASLIASLQTFAVTVFSYVFSWF